MPNATFNTPDGQSIAREMLVCFLNTGSYASPTWNPIGTSVDNSDMNLDWSVESSQDILGNVNVSMKTPVVTQSFDGVELREGDPAYEYIWTNGVQNHDAQTMSACDVMIAHLYAGTSATPFAERYPKSAIAPTSIGGEGGGVINMPFDLTCGGEREVGTCAQDAQTGAYSFTKAA